MQIIIIRKRIESDFHLCTHPSIGIQYAPIAETRLSTVRYDKAGVLGLAESKTVNKPVLRVGLVVIAMYFPSELVTGVPVDMPSTPAVVKSAEPSAIFNAVTNELHFPREASER